MKLIINFSVYIQTDCSPKGLAQSHLRGDQVFDYKNYVSSTNFLQVFQYICLEPVYIYIEIIYYSLVWASVAL